MKAVTRNIFRVVVSLIFIVLGLSSAIPGVLGLVANIANIQFHMIWAVAFDVIMFFAGLLGLLKMKRSTCTVLAVILFIGFAIAAASGFMANAGILTVAFAVAKALVAWLYIGCVK